MRVIADDKQVSELIDRLAKAIAADMKSLSGGGDRGDWGIVGIRSRGDVLARRLAQRLKLEPSHVGSLDITLYRDDLSEIGSQPVVRTTEIPFGLDGLHVVLVDDVLMTGRSIRAALQSLMDFGRPRRVWLSVLIDRGGRELPIAADHVGLDLSRDGEAAQIGPDELVEVRLNPTDERDGIVIRGKREERTRE
jgi:pyrimidine operon attenuation protein/uracil phosphoribosyltransferase